MAFMPVKTEARKVHIYEILNRTRLESLLVVTTSDSADIGSRLKREPPSEADGWAPGDDTAVEILIRPEGLRLARPGETPEVRAGDVPCSSSRSACSPPGHAPTRSQPTG